MQAIDEAKVRQVSCMHDLHPRPVNRAFQTRLICALLLLSSTAQASLKVRSGGITDEPASGRFHRDLMPDVSNCAGGAGVKFWSYDANGNLTDASGTLQNRLNSATVSFSRSLTYTSFNLPATISQTQNAATHTYSYAYGPGQERVKLVTARPDDTLTSVYLHADNRGDLRYERETRQSDGRQEHKYYVATPAGLLGVYVVTSAISGTPASEGMRYYHRDHLGSIVAISDAAGAQLERLGYEGFGERRKPDGGPQDRTSPEIGISTDRGYTGHEHLDELNLIHMNGRIYDPALARFMTPDAIVQDPLNLQSYNRYSYGFNNPLSGTDPSGHIFGIDDFLIGLALIGGARALNIIDDRTARTVASLWIGAGFIPGGPLAISGLTGFGNAVVGGFAAGFVSGGSVESGVQGAFGAALFAGAGGIGPEQSFQRVAAHAVAGCLSASAGGGSCATGAASAVVGKLVTYATSGVQNPVVQGIIVAVSGGKFANGALTAGFGYLFNALQEHWARPETLNDHFSRHGPDFGASNADDYVQKSQQFRSDALNNPKTALRVEKDGTYRIYDRATNTFGSYNPDGSTKHHPTPAVRALFFLAAGAA